MENSQEAEEKKERKKSREGLSQNISLHKPRRTEEKILIRRTGGNLGALMKEKLEIQRIREEGFRGKSSKGIS